MNEMTYTEWLEKEINIYKRENKLLNEKLDNLNTMFNDVHNKKNETLKQTYTLEEEINIYKRENNLLNDKLENITTMFNEVHDNELETREKKNDILKWAYSLEKELHEKNNEIINLKTEIVDHRIKAYRLTKILNETSDYT